MRTLIGVAALLVAMATPGTASEQQAERHPAPAAGQFSYGRMAMPLLPHRHQSHCGFYNGHFICADHCGVEYQIYSCSRTATGCCHVGQGYCDSAGLLRCSPAWF
jgi:hypothetical protein